MDIYFDVKNYSLNVFLYTKKVTQESQWQEQ